MQTSNHFGYSTRVWLTSAFVAPVLMTLFFVITDPGSDIISIIPLMVIFGLILSIPNWLLLIISVWQINKSNIPNEEKKTIISFLAFFLTLVLFLILDSGGSELILISTPYIIVLIFGIWKYELIPPIKEIKQSAISKKVKVLEDILDDENY